MSVSPVLSFRQCTGSDYSAHASDDLSLDRLRITVIVGVISIGPLGYDEAAKVVGEVFHNRWFGRPSILAQWQAAGQRRPSNNRSFHCKVCVAAVYLGKAVTSGTPETTQKYPRQDCKRRAIMSRRPLSA